MLISTCFPNRKFEPEFYFELLKDLKDGPFLEAVIDICKNLKELYPDSNLLAILRDKTTEISRRPKVLPALPQGGRFENGPSKEFKKLVKDLAEKKNA